MRIRIASNLFLSFSHSLAVASWEVSHWSDCDGRIPQTVFCTNEGGYSTLYAGVFRADGTVHDLKKFSVFPEPGVIGGALDWELRNSLPISAAGADIRATRQVFSLAADNQTLAFTFSSPRYPSNIYAFNLFHPEPAKPVTFSFRQLNPSCHSFLLSAHESPDWRPIFAFSLRSLPTLLILCHRRTHHPLLSLRTARRGVG